MSRKIVKINSGRQEADLRLADRYMMGEGVVRNPTRAKRLMQQAARGPNAKWRGDANYRLGCMHETGISGYVKRNRVIALRYFQEGAADGDKLASHRIRRLEYFPDIFIKLRKDEFSAPRPRKNLPGDLKRGNELFAQEKYAETLPIITYHAKRGSSDAQYTLAIMYALGYGVEVDKLRCRAWCYLAATSGNPSAQCALGSELYYDTTIFDCGYEIALWLKRAAKRNHPEAIALLGLLALYPRDYAQKRDVKLGLSRLEAAASRGSSFAMLTLGDLYLGRRRHVDMTTDPGRAKAYYMAAVDAGEPEARDRLRKEFKVKYDGKGKTAPTKKPQSKVRRRRRT